MTFNLTATHDDFADEQHVRDAWWHPTADQVVVDAGAGVGSYTLPALAAGARVWSFCPDDAPAALLAANVAANPDFADRWRLYRDGLYSREGWMALNEARTRYLFAEGEPEEGGFRVRPLDSLSFFKLDWLKVDVEGAELEVLRGAERTIRRCLPTIIVECHLFMDPGLQAAVEGHVLGLRLGYRAESMPWHSVAHVYFRQP